MNPWFEIMIVLTVSGSISVVCLLGLHLVLQNIVTAKWLYRMRKIVLFLFVIPVWFILEKILFYIIRTNYNTAIIEEYLEVAISEHYLSIELATVILIAWGIGAVIFSSWHIYCYQKFNKDIKKNNLTIKVDDGTYQLLNRYKEKLEIKRNIELAYNNQVASPMLIGLFRPLILLPTSEMHENELGMVFHHELTHFKQRDLWIKIIMLVANAIHWFNPFVYKLRNDIQIWSEHACDEAVVMDMSRVERKQYGEMILNMLDDSYKNIILYSTLLSGNKNMLKTRLTMMLNVRPMRKFTLVITVLIMIGVGLSGITASAFSTVSPITIADSKTDRTTIETDNPKVEGIINKR